MARLRVNDAVMVPMSPADLMIGARVMQEPDVDGVWIDICSCGTHLPQRYRLHEVTPLDAERAEAEGLCVDCLGYGTPLHVVDVPVASSIDQLPELCSGCGGTGRPFIKVEVMRSAHGVEMRMTFEPHEFLGDGEFCKACSVDRGHHD